MKKSLLMLLMAGVSFFMLPACGDDDDDDNNNNNNSIVESKFEISDIPGAYVGSLSTSGSKVADSLGVNVENAGDNKINLSLDPIVIMGITIDQLSFPGIDCTYNDSTSTWNFTAEGLHVVLMNGAVEADVDVKSGKFSKGGKLDFTVNVKSNMLDLDMDYTGNK